MDESRELQIHVKRLFLYLVEGGLAMIGTAVAAAGLVIAVGGAPEALAAQPGTTKTGMVKSPVERRAPGDGIDFFNAIPMALPESTVRPASQAEAMFRAPAAKPRSRPGATGSGRQTLVVLVPAKQIPDNSTSGEAVPQEFGTGGVPYTTSQANAFFDDTDTHYPFRAAGKLFFNVGTQTFVCSASLIARGLVVTAAHCVANFGQNQFYTNWQFVPAYNNGAAPYGIATAKTATVLTSYLEGTDPCFQAGVIWENDVAVITLNPASGTYVGTNTGWLGIGVDGYGFTPAAWTQITRLGYPVALDDGLLMERTDSLGYVDGNLSDNTIIGSLMTGGSSGGPWVLNLGMPPSLSGTNFGQAAHHNLVVGVTGWGLVERCRSARHRGRGEAARTPRWSCRRVLRPRVTGRRGLPPTGSSAELKVALSLPPAGFPEYPFSQSRRPTLGGELMPKTARPRRSVLYMPGSNARALDKAKNIAADALILDLEDAVAPDAKNLARAQVCKAVRDGGYGLREIVIRVNGLATPWGYEDIAAASRSRADAILLPKVESADAIRHLESIMRANGAPDGMAIWAMMETPRSVLASEQIANATPRMECLVMGTSDLAKELDCAHTHERLPFITSLGLCLLAARAYSLAILDGVYLDLKDEAGFDFACRQGAEMGFDGKTLIHPNQVAKCNEVFTPRPEDVEWSRKIIAAHSAAAARGEGVAVVDGKLIENLHVESATRLVKMAEAIDKMQAALQAAE